MKCDVCGAPGVRVEHAGRQMQLVVEFCDTEPDRQWKWSIAWVRDGKSSDDVRVGWSATRKQARSAALSAARRRLESP